jgi:hypothetical protein
MKTTETREGRVWCLTHETWWKQCSCPGELSLRVQGGVMDPADVVRLTEFLDKKLGEVSP